MKQWLTGVLLLVVLIGAFFLVRGSGHHRDAGLIEGDALPKAVVDSRSQVQLSAARRLAKQAAAATPAKQILFGDLHVHSTFSADAFAMSLPLMQGEGAHPVADACDFARYCSGLDFWSINDHAEGVTPARWRDTKEAIRQCNAVAGGADDPDIVAFLGWEWTQIGRTPAEHYGHKNVILLDTEDAKVPVRPIHSGAAAAEMMRRLPVLSARVAPPLLDWANRQEYLDLGTYLAEIRETPLCPDGVDTRELPADCSEGAVTPEILYDKLDQWGFDSIVIPHGTTWGIYTPPGSTWDKQLTSRQHDPNLQSLIEVYSGHGNSEEYRDWRAAEWDERGSHCLEPREGFEPCCWRAGEIIRGRCAEPRSEECERRVEQARRNYLDASTAGRATLPDATVADWGNCDSCPDCYNPSFSYRPGGAVQYIMALSNFDGPGDPMRFRFGFMASSDNHRSRPGTGYKEYGRLYNTEAHGPRDEAWYYRMYPTPQDPPSPVSEAVDVTDPNLLLRRLDMERQVSFFMTGGLVATHSEGRSRGAIWQSLKRREVYGTSGDRILLWFDLMNGPRGPLPMGSEVEMAVNPRFRVRAAGSLEQKPGCPRSPSSGLTPERLENLCRGECYNPGDQRRLITRIEVVRIRPQAYKGEPVAGLIEDPWRVIECPGDPAGCTVEFEDEAFSAGGREATYYVRAIQESTPAVNAGGLRCEYDEAGNCVRVNPCYGDYRTAKEDDCLSPNEERAWSSPVFVRPRS